MLLFENIPTNKALTTKLTAYTNTGKGITEPQRRIVLALAKGKGHFLREQKTMKGKRHFRCYDKEMNLQGRFSAVVVQNLVSKGYLKKINNKFYLK